MAALKKRTVLPALAVAVRVAGLPAHTVSGVLVVATCGLFTVTVETLLYTTLVLQPTRTR